jgi:uncharacterized protein YutE (UPF0331/DUF86 family)
LVDRDVLHRRLAKLEELLRQLRGLAQVDRRTYLSSPEFHAQGERWLHLAAECGLDIAHHVIADAGWGAPATYREAFRKLAENQVLTDTLASQMETWAGLRNLLVHIYLEVDQERLYEILTRDLDQLEEYSRRIAEHFLP